MNLGAGEFLVGFAGFVCGLDSGLNNKKESGGAGVKRNEKGGLEKKIHYGKANLRKTAKNNFIDSWECKMEREGKDEEAMQ